MRRQMLNMCLVLAALQAIHVHAAPPIPPTPRDYRAAWCATVSRIDWPPVAGVSASNIESQKARLIQHLDMLEAANMNAMYFQVRPACDAVYNSTLEPPSIWYTGSQFTSPSAIFDPLTFAVEEAHKRGIELHAWINPYRAALDQNLASKASNHVTKARPDLCVNHTDGRIYMNPGKAGTITWIQNVVADIVTRYDIDGVVFDDYFYPGTNFNDSATYQEYVNSGGTLSLDDWRRDNVNRLIQGCYNTVHGIRNSCQFSVGPFGIWRPGNPPGIVGSDYYATHYCDTKLWLQQGWVDSLSPQLYWPLGSPGQPFGPLIDWWAQQNPSRHVLASTAPYRVGDSTFANWGGTTASEIVNQVNRTHQGGGVGNVHFSIRWFTDDPNNSNILEALVAGPYAKDALRPASTWLDNTPPPPPTVSMSELQGSPARRTLSFSQNPTDEKATWWCVNTYDGTTWTLKVLPGSATNLKVGPEVQDFAVSAVDRVGNESARAQVQVPVTISRFELE